ncbi:Arm DNA-binding domain-containing protein [Proteiniphilum sp. X52]|uniref:Arm DNA-binding domain-containing protein n=1 Tax=Proteiniphilum sp. X52 TaxID=2382159 RepID=UPI002100E4F1|nr:Arm DNA-binding domain-containing protein [Proteiniphilum sp. X52]
MFCLKKNELRPDGKAPVMGRITFNGTIAQFSCKLNVIPSLWDTKANRASGKSIEAQKINRKLDNIRTQIGKQYQRISDKDNFVSAEKIKNGYLGFGDEYRTLLSIADEFYEQYAKRVGKDRTEGSYEQMLINRKRMELFLGDRYNLSDIPIKK